jgi:ribonuclease BN (tRNA processing enzyme)
MDGAHTGQSRTIDDFFDLRILDTESEADILGLRVRCRFTGHPVPTIGLLISDGDRTLGWSGDTPFEQAHIDWLSKADVIVHECNLGSPHTPIEALNALPDALRAKIRLIHLPDDFDESTTDMTPLRHNELLEI